VWNAISKQLQLGKTAAPRKSWLASVWNYVPVAAFASIAASVVTVLLLNLGSQPNVYMANMKSPLQQDKMMVAMVYHDTMEIAFEMPTGALPVKDDMMPTVWCISKDSNKPPMRMGTLTAKGENRLPIDKAAWEEMANVSAFAISLEPMDKPPSEIPLGEVIFNGELAAL
jgi:anti-sigma-K factor RskA